MTTEQKIEALTWFDTIGKEKTILKELLAKIEELEDSVFEPSDSVAEITPSNLPAVAGTYADLAAARTSVAAQNVAVEERFDANEAKINEIIIALNLVP